MVKKKKKKKTKKKINFFLPADERNGRRKGDREREKNAAFPNGKL